MILRFDRCSAHGFRLRTRAVAVCSANAVNCVPAACAVCEKERDRGGYYYGDNDDETDAHNRLTGHWRPRAPRKRRSIKFALSVLATTPFLNHHNVRLRAPPDDRFHRPIPPTTSSTAAEHCTRQYRVAAAKSKIAENRAHRNSCPSSQQRVPSRQITRGYVQ